MIGLKKCECKLAFVEKDEQVSYKYIIEDMLGTHFVHFTMPLAAVLSITSLIPLALHQFYSKYGSKLVAEAIEEYYNLLQKQGRNVKFIRTQDYDSWQRGLIAWKNLNEQPKIST